ncbi:MAG: 30S ribosomal protein S17e [Nitrososphaeria archaeon]
MGLVRNLSLDLIQNHKEEFTSDFEQNKKVIEKYINFRSKSLRNMVAGYITGYINKNAEVPESEEKENPNAE